MTFNQFSASGQRWARATAVVAVGVAALAATGAAQANGNVFWSVGLAGPGVQVAVANGPQYYAQPAPVYYEPAPVYVQPAPVYYRPAPVYYRPARVVVPAPVYYRRGHAHRQVAWVQPGHGYGQGYRNSPQLGRGNGNGNGNGNGHGYSANTFPGVGYGR